MANPEALGRYRLKRLLGRGGLGEVWEATDRDCEGMKVAVKIMHAADEELTHARYQFAREARIAAVFRHPHVVAVQDAGEAAGTSFMVMEMVEGTPLRKLLGDPATTTADKLRWLREIGDGLAAMHRAGLVHRDLKPENVIVRSDRTACIVDLGIAKWTKFYLGGERDPAEIDPSETLPPNADYAPPEAIEDEQPVYDELGDQYAWGVLAHEVLSGALPRESSPPLPVGTELTAAAVAAIERARSRRRAGRWDAMEVLLDELVVPTDSVAAVSRDSPQAEEDAARTGTVDASSEQEPSAGRARPPLVLIGAAAVALLVVFGLIVAVAR